MDETPTADYDAPVRPHQRPAEHVTGPGCSGSICARCGCCWCCDPDCCAERFCPNPECGCSASMRGGTITDTRVIPPG